MLKHLAILFLHLSSSLATPVPSLETHPVVDVRYDISTDTYITAPILTELSETMVVESILLLEPAFIDRTAPEWSLPIDWDVTSTYQLGKPHHDYPASDIIVPVGTNVYAIQAGVITMANSDDRQACGGIVMLRSSGAEYMYCHLSKVVVKYGQQVEAGDLIGLSGGRPGAYGAGSSTTPHLHIGMTRAGRTWCPQPLLVSVFKSEEPDLTNSTRCVG